MIRKLRAKEALFRSLLILCASTLLLSASAFFVIWPAFADSELGEFTGESTETALVLKWFTLSETDLARWDIYCKDESQPSLAYHPIGTEPAQGDAGNGAAYTFPVPDLTPNVSYCFRLIEINIDGSTGESYDRCGWGYNVTPTPTPIPPDPAGVVESTPVGSLSLPISGEGAVPPQNVPTSTPTPTEALSLPTATATAIGESPVGTATIFIGPADSTGTGQSQDQTNTGSTSGNGAVALAPPTATPPPDPGYVVVTATPTSEMEAVAELPPTFTPLPTATVEAVALFNGFSERRSEDIVLAALCFVFFGAGGLGVLGITSLSLYLRSRSGAGRQE